MGMTRITTLLRRLLAHRRLLAALAALACVLALSHVVTAQGGPTTQVYVATTRIPGGTTISLSLVKKVEIPVFLVPNGAITDVGSLADQMTTGPIPGGGILTTENFIATSLADDGYVILPLTVSSQILTVVKPGDHISIFLNDPTTGQVKTSRGIRVVTIPTTSSSGMFSSSSSASFILVEVPEEVVALITAAGGLGSTTVALE